MLYPGGRGDGFLCSMRFELIQKERWQNNTSKIAVNSRVLTNYTVRAKVATTTPWGTGDGVPPSVALIPLSVSDFAWFLACYRSTPILLYFECTSIEVTCRESPAPSSSSKISLLLFSKTKTPFEILSGKQSRLFHIEWWSLHKIHEARR